MAEDEKKSITLSIFREGLGKGFVRFYKDMIDPEFIKSERFRNKVE